MKTITEVLQDTILQHYNGGESSEELTAVIHIAMQAWADEQTEQLQVTNLELNHQIDKLKQTNIEVAIQLRRLAIQIDRAEQLAKHNQLDNPQSLFDSISRFMRQGAKTLNPKSEKE